MSKELSPILVEFLNEPHPDLIPDVLDGLSVQASQARLLGALTAMFEEGPSRFLLLAAAYRKVVEVLSEWQPESRSELKHYGSVFLAADRELRRLRLFVPWFFPTPLNEFYVISKNLAHGVSQDIEAFDFAWRAVVNSTFGLPLEDLLKEMKAIATEPGCGPKLKPLVDSLEQRALDLDDPVQKRWDQLETRLRHLEEMLSTSLWTSTKTEQFQDSVEELDRLIGRGELEQAHQHLEKLEKAVRETDELAPLKEARNFYLLLNLIRGVHAGTVCLDALRQQFEKMVELHNSFTETLVSGQGTEDQVDAVGEELDLIEEGFQELERFLSEGELLALSSAYDRLHPGVTILLSKHDLVQDLEPEESVSCLKCGADNDVLNRVCTECHAVLIKRMSQTESRVDLLVAVAPSEPEPRRSNFELLTEMVRLSLPAPGPDHPVFRVLEDFQKMVQEIGSLAPSDPELLQALKRVGTHLQNLQQALPSGLPVEGELVGLDQLGREIEERWAAEV